MQQYDFLRTAQYNPQTRQFELKMMVSNQAPTDFLAGEPVQGEEHAVTYFRRVPWLFRAVELRANAVSNVPFRLLRGDTEIDRSDEWQNKAGIMPNPVNLLWLTEAALAIWGQSYLYRERNQVKALPLRYIVPSTIEPDIDEVEGLRGFYRNLSTRRWVSTESIVYFWMPDPSVELGPPTGSSVIAAMSAAGVLFAVDQFAAAFVNRGAIKATMLTVEGNPDDEEKKRLRSWWQRAVTGIQNAFSSNVFSAIVKPVVVGEGLESLANAELTASRREDIATAMGVPQTLLFSTAAGGLGGGGVVTSDNWAFYDKTIRAECEFIASTLNEQLWAPLGYRMEFRLDEMDVFQQDEKERASAFQAYVASGVPLSCAAEMLGLELPPGWEYDDLDRKPEPPPVPEPMQASPVEPPRQSDFNATDKPKAAVDDLRKWRAKSQKRGRLADFESYDIPGEVMAAIRTADDWQAALDAAIDGEDMEVKAQPAQVDALVDALRAMTEALLNDA